MNHYCSSSWDMRNLQEQAKKAFCYQKLFWTFTAQKLFWPFTVQINCSSDLKKFANFQPSALNFKCFSRSLEQFFLTVGQNNFGNKIPFLNSFTQVIYSWTWVYQMRITGKISLSDSKYRLHRTTANLALLKSYK